MNLTPKEMLCLHALRTLPDSTRERRLILDGVRQILPPDNQIRQSAKELLQCLHLFDAAQKELPFSTSIHVGDGEESKGKS